MLIPISSLKIRIIEDFDYKHNSRVLTKRTRLRMVLEATGLYGGVPRQLLDNVPTNIKNAESVRQFQPRVALWQPWDHAFHFS